MDWIPCENWGDGYTIVGDEQREIPLLDIGEYLGGNVVGTPDENSRMFVHRIVGHYALGRLVDPVARPLVYMRLWPGMVDTAIPGVVTPGFLDEAEAANARFWWDKIVELDASGTYTFMNPLFVGTTAFCELDIRPNQVLDENTVPVFSVFNADTEGESCYFTHWFRMLVTML